MAFNMLPFDVIEIICSHLDTLDVLKLCVVERQMQELSCYLFRKALLRSDQYIEPDLFTSFSRTRFKECLTVLDITSIYWIPADDIRSCIFTMVNLETLYAIDTKIELSELDIITYNLLPKLKKLGVSVCTPNLYERDAHDVYNYPQITHLYVHFDYAVGQQVKKILERFVRMKTIEELWLVEVTSHGDASIVFGGLSLEEVQRLFVSPMMIDDSILFGDKTKIFSTNFYEERQCYYDKAYLGKGVLPLLEGLAESDWNPLLTLCPFNFAQAKKLFNGVQISMMSFDEINLVHPMRCRSDHMSLVAAILLSESMKNLKKLSLNYCCCIGKPASNDERSLLQRIVETSPLIEELELWSCPRVVSNPDMVDTALEPIAKLKYLKRVVLDSIPLSISGSFLKFVCSECVNLRSLSISSAHKHNILHQQVCNVLESVTELKDFRYQVPAISYDILLESLLKNDRLKLRRIYIESRLMETLSDDKFRQFLSRNPQLQFLQIVGNAKTKKEILNSTLDEFNDGGWKYLAVSNNPFQYKHNMPLIHYYDIVKHFPTVSAVNTLHDYKS